MDLLKRELEKKRKAATADFGGKSFVRRSELEQKQLQKRRHEEHRQLLAKAHRPAPPRVPTRATPTPTLPSPPPRTLILAPPQPPVPPRTSCRASRGRRRRRMRRSSDELDLPRHEVVRRFRILRELVMLFGEDDAARLARLKFVLKSGVIDDIDDHDMTEGQTNDFLLDMVELRKRQKAGRDTYVKGKGKRVGGGDGGEGGAGGDNADYGDGDARRSGDDADASKDSKRMKTRFEELLDEDKILVFFKKLLIGWNQELDEMPELEKRTVK